MPVEMAYHFRWSNMHYEAVHWYAVMMIIFIEAVSYITELSLQITKKNECFSNQNVTQNLICSRSVHYPMESYQNELR